MNYLEALKRSEGYSYLKEQGITNIKSGKKSTVAYITVVPSDGNKGDYNWVNPYDKKYAASLSNRDCELLFLLDFTRHGDIKATMLSEDRLKNYYQSASNDPSSIIKPMP